MQKWKSAARIEADRQLDQELAEDETRFGKKPNLTLILADSVVRRELGSYSGAKARRRPDVNSPSRRGSAQLVGVVAGFPLIPQVAVERGQRRQDFGIVRVLTVGPLENRNRLAGTAD